MFDFPDAAGRAPDKQFCFSPEGANSPYETIFGLNGAVVCRSVMRYFHKLTQVVLSTEVQSWNFGSTSIFQCSEKEKFVRQFQYMAVNNGIQG